jgi:hypothetical protein
MKITRNVLFALLLLGCAAGAASAATSFSAGVHVGSYGRAAVDLGFFYDNLASYGHWIQRPHYGWVWTPRSVASGWRPYSQGRWVDSDQGWTWLSDEPFGWATYHYGRWYQDPQIGWAWVPGTQWGPAWVSWQEGNDYVGWAPLPPDAEVAGYRDDYAYDGYDNGGYDNGYDNGYGYDDGYGYDGYDQGYGYGGYGGGYGYGGYGYGGSGVSVSFSFGLGPAAYLFVPTRYFLAPSLYSYYVPYAQVYTIFRGTRNCTDYRYYGGHYYNRGVPYDHIRRVVGHVPRYQLSELGNFRDGRYGSRIEGNRVAFFRPQIQRNVRVAPPISRAEARRSVVTADRFRSAYPDRVARVQRDRQTGQSYRNGNQARGYQPRDNRPYVQGQQGQGRNGRVYEVPRQQQRDRQQYQQQYQGNRNQRTYEVPRQQQYQQQQDRAERQRAYESQQRQYQRPQYQQQDRQYQNDRQRAYDYQRGQAQAERQRAYESQRQQQYQRQTERQQYQRPQVRSNDRQDRQPQVRGESRGQARQRDNNGGDNRRHGRGNGHGQ